MRYPDRLDRLRELEAGHHLVRFGALVWLARYRKEPRQARHSQQPGVIDWLADACMRAFAGCAGQLAAAIAPSTTPWPAGIWRGNRGVAAIRAGRADMLCSSHGVAETQGRGAADTDWNMEASSIPA